MRKLKKLEMIINALEVRISELDSIIEGYIFPIKDYQYLASKYFEGWIYYISLKFTNGTRAEEQFIGTMSWRYMTAIWRNTLISQSAAPNQIFKKSS